MKDHTSQLFPQLDNQKEWIWSFDMIFTLLKQYRITIINFSPVQCCPFKVLSLFKKVTFEHFITCQTAQ